MSEADFGMTAVPIPHARKAVPTSALEHHLDRQVASGPILGLRKRSFDVKCPSVNNTFSFVTTKTVSAFFVTFFQTCLPSGGLLRKPLNEVNIGRRLNCRKLFSATNESQYSRGFSACPEIGLDSSNFFLRANLT